MFEISAKSHFAAAHHLRGYHGKCEAPHGHNWEIEVFVRGKRTDKSGILLDFRKLKKVLRTTLEKLDHTDLNKVAAFRSMNPTSENIARFLFEKVGAALNCDDYSVSRVCVRETPETGASYSED